VIPGGPIDPKALLRKLLPAGAPSRTTGPRPSIETSGFEELLLLASSGEIGSGRPVQVPPSAGVDPPLDDAQIERLGAAADRAEAAGSRRSLVLLDGRGLVLDVAGRRVEHELRFDAPDGGLAGGVDTAVLAPPRESDAANAVAPLFARSAREVLKPPGALMPPAAARSVLDALARRGPPDGDATAA